MQLALASWPGNIKNLDSVAENMYFHNPTPGREAAGKAQNQPPEYLKNRSF
jgi:hypothetical protein